MPTNILEQKKQVLIGLTNLTKLGSFDMNFGNFGAIAQLGERLNGIQEVSGSIPLSSTLFNNLSKLQKLFYLYILLNSITGKFYIGQTKDLQRRLIYHNSGYGKSTRGEGHWELVYQEMYKTRRDAVNREREIKLKKSREFIKALIHSVERPE